MTTSDFIKRLMVLSRMNQSELSRALKQPASRINEWLNTGRTIKFDEAIRLCLMLGIYPGHLFEKDDSIEHLCEEISILSQKLQSKINH